MSAAGCEVSVSALTGAANLQDSQVLPSFLPPTLFCRKAGKELDDSEASQ